LLDAITKLGYETPTPIQENAIPQVLMGRDILGSAQTGTGKTASFTLPMIDILSSGRAKARMPRSLILAPTRELAAQVAESFEKFAINSDLSMALLIGGVSFSDQETALDRGVDVLIATPGRLLDHFERGKVLLQDVKILVIDEADRMLDMGFIPDVERIVSYLPTIRQTLFFSATLSDEIHTIGSKFVLNSVNGSNTSNVDLSTTSFERYMWSDVKRAEVIWTGGDKVKLQSRKDKTFSSTFADATSTKFYSKYSRNWHTKASSLPYSLSAFTSANDPFSLMYDNGTASGAKTYFLTGTTPGGSLEPNTLYLDLSLIHI